MCFVCETDRKANDFNFEIDSTNFVVGYNTLGYADFVMNDMKKSSYAEGKATALNHNCLTTDQAISILLLNCEGDRLG